MHGRFLLLLILCFVGFIALGLPDAVIGVAWPAIAITLIGFASGPIFPSMIATTPARVGPKHTANAVGLQISVAAIGLAALPALCGLTAQAFGLESITLLLGARWMILLGAYSALARH